ncbi:hypothetical protein Aperf_G00000125491 [Anoplocephala perfoliata]
MLALTLVSLFIYDQCVGARVPLTSEKIIEWSGNGTEVPSLAPLLANEFSKFARDELGTMTLQAAFDRLEYEQKPENSAQWDLDSLVDQLSLRLRHYGHLVSNPQALVIQLHREHMKSPISPRFDCCNLSERDLRYEALYGARVSRRKCCDLIPFNLPVAAFNPGHNLTQRFRRQLEYWPNVKWLYFITAAGLHTEFPAHNFRAATVASALVESIAAAAAAAAVAAANSAPSVASSSAQTTWQSSVDGKQRERRHLPPSLLTALYDCRSVHQLRHRDVLVRSVVTQPIWLVMILDQSEVSKTRMLLGQRVARLLLASLSEKDRVALIIASDTTRITTLSATSNVCLLPATHETKLFLSEHIYGLRSSGVAKTNHTRALLEAFRILYDAVEAKKHELPNTWGLGPLTDNMLIAYISRGSLDDLQEQNAILRQVTEQQARLGNRVIINTYMPVEEKSATVLFEKTFMNDLATRWNVHSDPAKYRPTDVRPGHFYAINRTADLAETVGRFYEVWLERQEKELRSLQGNLTKGNTSDAIPNPTSGAHSPSKLYFSLPYEDLEGKGLVMSISQAFYDGDTFLGVMGVDLHTADLLDQIVHYGGSPASNFVFLVDATTGLSVYHPGGLRDLLTSPTSNSQNRRSSATGSASNDGTFHSSSSFQDPLLHVDVRYLERTPGFESLVLPRIMRGEINGTADWLVEIDPGLFARIETAGVWSENIGTLVSPDQGASDSNNHTKHLVKVTYRWRRITDPDTQFVMVLRSTESVHAPPPRQLVEITPPFDSWYHRLDLFKRDQACLYLRQLATFSSTTIYLPPRTFMRPFEHLISASTASSFASVGADDVVGRGESAEEVRHLVAYLTDQTALISNPGLRVSPSAPSSPDATGSPSVSSASAPDARTAVAVVERIGKFWRQRGTAASGGSALGRFIIRRYVSTETGVMLMYPGTLMPQNFDATTRPWFARAVESAGRIVFTEPYLDHGGAGHIVSIAYAIFEGSQSGVHNPSTDRVQAVMAMDVPYRFFNHLLAIWLPNHCAPELSRPINANKTSSLKAKSSPKNKSSKHSPLGSPQKEISSTILELLEGYGVRVEASGAVNSDEERGSRKTDVEIDVEESTKEKATNEEDEVEEEEDRGSMKCLLMNDRGYLIAYPGFAEPVQGSRALESYHISHREPLVAADLLNHNEFVRKVACMSHSQRTLERYYIYNTSYDGIVTNSAPGDHCTRYQFELIPGTNLFVGLVHESAQKQRERHRIRRSDDSSHPGCSPRSAFCACSTKDRRCLNCGRLEPLECECPCQCPLGAIPSFIPPSNSTNNTSGLPLEIHPACPVLSHEAVVLPMPKASAAGSWKALARLPDAPPLCQQSNVFSKRVPVAPLSEWLSALLPQSATSSTLPPLARSSGPLVPALGPTDCTAIRSARRKTECTASIGCEYCLVGTDGKPVPGEGFCAPMGVCFGGVIGGLSPYATLPSTSTYTKSSASDSSGTSSGPRELFLNRSDELLIIPHHISAPMGLLDEKWSLFPPPPPPPSLPPPPSNLPSSPGNQPATGSFYNFQKTGESQSAAAAAHFYHYYYYYHYYHNQQQQQQAGKYPGDEDLYASPYILARHYITGERNNVAGGGGAAGLMAAWSNSNPVGPVAGAVLAVFIVLLLGVYCLRHQAASRARQNAAAAALAAGNCADCGMTGLLGGERRTTDGDSANQSGCGKNHQGDKVCCCERPLESGTDKDKPPPTAGAVALIVKAASISSTAGSGADDNSVSACDVESEHYAAPLRPPISVLGSQSVAATGAAGTAAAIIIEGVGVFVKSNAFSNEQLARVPEEKAEMPLAEFLTDPTAVSPYRVTESTKSVTASNATGADASSPTDDQMTTVSSSAATTTDHGYVSNERPSSSCAESSSIADSFVPGPGGEKPNLSGKAGLISNEVETTLTLGSDCETNAGTTTTATTNAGPWIGTLILGPGMDDVMCAEELENQLILLSAKRGHSLQQSQPQIHHSQCSRLLPSWRKAYQHYRQLHNQSQSQPQHRCHNQQQGPHETPIHSSNHQHQASASGRNSGVLARFPVLVQPPPPSSSLQALQVQPPPQQTSSSTATVDNIL